MNSKTLPLLISGFGVLVGVASAQTITGKVINNTGTQRRTAWNVGASTTDIMQSRIDSKNVNTGKYEK